MAPTNTLERIATSTPKVERLNEVSVIEGQPDNTTDPVDLSQQSFLLLDSSQSHFFFIPGQPDQIGDMLKNFALGLDGDPELAILAEESLQRQDAIDPSTWIEEVAKSSAQFND